jgi:hypothetical protein
MLCSSIIDIPNPTGVSSMIYVVFWACATTQKPSSNTSAICFFMIYIFSTNLSASMHEFLANKNMVGLAVNSFLHQRQ